MADEQPNDWANSKAEAQPGKNEINKGGGGRSGGRRRLKAI